jgi:hypothetical protein
VIAASVQRDVIRCGRARLPKPLPLRTYRFDGGLVGNQRILGFSDAQGSELGLRVAPLSVVFLVVVVVFRFVVVSLEGLGDSGVVVIVVGGFEEAFEDDGGLGGGGARGGEGSGVLLEREERLFGIGTGLGLDIGGDGGGGVRPAIGA